jgi:membrane protein DedA with SNARE-associated domain
VIVVAVIAAIIGDNIGFVIGHFGGRPLVHRYGRYIFLTPERLDTAEGYFNRHGGKIVTIARFIAVLRQLNGILSGIIGMHWAKFLAFNALGAVLWVCTWAGLGYLAGQHIVAIYATIERYKWYAFAAAALIAAALITRRIRARRRDAPSKTT